MSNLAQDACFDQTHTGARWLKSSFSFANGDCVEVAALPDGRIGVRDSIRWSCAPMMAEPGGAAGRIDVPFPS
jgi:hypothetical protein